MDSYIERKCTTSEKMFIYYLADRQSYHGRVERIYYKDVMQAIGCKKDTFYNMLNNLGKKITKIIDNEEYIVRHQLIEVDWSNETYGYWNINLLYNEYRGYDDNLFHDDIDNVSKYPELAESLTDEVNLDMQRGYTQIKKFIFSKDFSELTQKAKKCGMLFLCFNNQTISKNKLKEKLGIKTDDTLMRILKSLDKWYKIKIEGDNIKYALYKQFRTKNVSNKKNNNHTLEVNRLRNKLVSYMRGCKRYSKDNIKKIAEDIAELYINYKKRIEEVKGAALNFFSRVVWCSIDERGVINAPYINVLLTELFSKDEQDQKPGDSYGAAAGNGGYNGSYNEQGKKKNNFDNFKGREYDTVAMDEYLMCRDNPEYFKKKYGHLEITLDDLFKKANKK